MGAWQGLGRERQARNGGLEQIAAYRTSCRARGRIQVFRQEGLGLGQGQGLLRGNKLSELFRTL